MKKEPNDNQVSQNPMEFMRGRHPDLFSDSKADEAIGLPRPVFEYHLDTLTSRKQEYEFEYFCRKLAEKEICPNLRVQTGPTGGGDSKVDTETYPVAEEISERWWVGDPSAGTERWAFAISAKKDWKAKVKADVANIISAGRDYKRIYFFTNQFVSDKWRSRVEDETFKNFGIPLHIIDRAWITEKVYENGHLNLAVSTLVIDGVRTETRKTHGPRDSTRLAELEELDSQVSDPDRYRGAQYQLVEDCLQSAILARSLERPRSEVESRFIQADRLAKDLSHPQQRARIAYNRAWTAYWWYEDYRGFGERYEELEQLLSESTVASELGRLLTLWQLLLPSLNSGRISSDIAKYEERTLRITEALKKIADDSSRPNNSLQAQTDLAIMKMTQVYQDGSAVERKRSTNPILVSVMRLPSTRWH